MQFVPLSSSSIDSNDVFANTKTLVIPQITVGNVGQLAVDVFLNTYLARQNFNSSHPFVKVGYLDHPWVKPMVAVDAFDTYGGPSEYSLPLELFICSEASVCILQQRTPAFEGHSKAYNRDLIRWAKEIGFEQIIGLTSFLSQYQTDRHLETKQVYMLPNAIFRPSPSEEELLQQCHIVQGSIPRNEFSNRPLVGYGVIEEFLNATTDAGLRSFLLGTFATEGDNAGDGVFLASSVQKVIFKDPVVSTSLKPPKSWGDAFGEEHDPDMYW